MKNFKKIIGDASHRNFFRKKDRNTSSIIVVSKKEKFKNLLVYDAINKILCKNKILAPTLLSENYSKNFIEIEDFGDDTIFNILSKKRYNKFFYFKKIILTLNEIQKIKDKSVKDFRNKTFLISKYNKEVLIKEANLFCNWYLKKNLSKDDQKKFTKKFKKLIKKLSLNLKLKNDIFVHRDFHVSNLMMVKKRIGIIDSQDALLGNRAYDVASLIDDVRLKTSRSLKDKVYKHYILKQKKLDRNKFKNDFEILSVLRNLKIIGIFTRLAIRDGKKKYLKLIPYTWALIDMRINENKIFKNLKKLLSQNFEGKIQ